MTNDELARLKALCAAATPGPWRVSPSRIGVVASCGDEWICSVSRVTPVLDVEFIAAARTALPRVVDALEIALEALRECAAAKGIAGDALDRIAEILRGDR